MVLDTHPSVSARQLHLFSEYGGGRRQIAHLAVAVDDGIPAGAPLDDAPGCNRDVVHAVRQGSLGFQQGLRLALLQPLFDGQRAEPAAAADHPHGHCRR